MPVKLFATNQLVLVDLDIALDVMNWGLSVVTKQDGYKYVIFTTGPYTRKRLSNYVLGFPVLQVDHKNGNTLDNTRDNLRLATRNQNMANRGKMLGGNLPKGVYEYKGSYMARLMINGKRIYLGLYKTPEAAGLAYEEAANRHQGEFAYHNSRNSNANI